MAGVVAQGQRDFSVIGVSNEKDMTHESRKHVEKQKTRSISESGL
jgi:hypothetical protein